MTLPDYEGGSIVNLMSSIQSALEADPGLYAPLPQLPAAALSDTRNIVLLVVDGLGHEYLLRRGSGGSLCEHLQGRITSVFPPTTVTAITTFLTGTAPQQHGLTGWFTYFKEIGSVAAVLPFIARYGGPSLENSGVDPRTLVDHPPLMERVAARCYAVLPQRIADSAYTRATCGDAARRPYSSLAELFKCVEEALREGEERKYVYAYWSDLDHLAHVHGVASPQVATRFAELDEAFANFLRSIEGTGTSVIVTADHGFIDPTREEQISLEDHPQLAATLMLPLCGEPRTAYCYVHPDKAEQFEKYVEGELAHCASYSRSAELIERGYFGLGEPHPRLAERIGHYVLHMKDHYAIKDWVIGEPRFIPIGVHGGLSNDG